ncbi:MAG TPA: hypothetical protein VFN29_06335 [Chiayiivirga sp.]|nr:hypothetical protein [Chiayiivirga sp.]
MSNAPLFTALAFVVCLSSGPTARAAEDENLPAAVNRVERETGGRVLSAERRTQSGRQLNRIKVYTPEGRVRVMWDTPRHAPPERGARFSNEQQPARREFQPAPRDYQPASREDRSPRPEPEQR